MNLAREFNWVPFHIVACTSEDYESPVDHLSNQQWGSQKSWECSRTAQFPIELVLRFHNRTQVDHILIATKYDKPIPKAEFYIGDGLSGGFQDCEYRRAGESINIINKAVQVKMQGIGNFIKIIIPEQPKRSPHNPTAQVSIQTLKVWGAFRHYLNGIKNEQIDLYGNRDSIGKMQNFIKITLDQMLVGLGIPVDLLNWFDEDDRNFEYAPIDNDSRETLNDLKRIRNSALKLQDYEALKQLKLDMRKVFDSGKKIWQIRRDLQFSVAQEDYTRAIELKKRLKALEQERDRIDALYETSRYEKLVSLNRPSTAEYLRNLEILENQERMHADALRRQRELEEQQRRRIIIAEQEKQKIDIKPQLDVIPWWDKQDDSPQIESKKKKKKATKKQEEELPVFNNPFAFNEGDVDLELYLNPQLAMAGEKIQEIPLEVLRRLNQQGFLTVFGARAWTGINNENWRIREAVAQAVLNFLEMPLPQKYQNGKSKKLFLAAMEFAKIATEDKLMQIYFLGLKILSTSLAPPICGTDVSPQVINKLLKEFSPLMLSKIEELNYRARDISLHTLLSIFKHPAAKIGILVQSCLDKLIIDPNYQSLFIPPDKQPQRVMIAKLEVILNILQEFGYDDREFNYEDIFFILAAPCLFHQSNEVRLLAIEVIAALYQLVGQQIRLNIDSLQNLKPGLKEQILARLSQVDEEFGVPPDRQIVDNQLQEEEQEIQTQKPEPKRRTQSQYNQSNNNQSQQRKTISTQKQNSPPKFQQQKTSPHKGSPPKVSPAKVQPQISPKVSPRSPAKISPKIEVKVSPKSPAKISPKVSPPKNITKIQEQPKEEPKPVPVIVEQPKIEAPKPPQPPEPPKEEPKKEEPKKKRFFGLF